MVTLNASAMRKFNIQPISEGWPDPIFICILFEERFLEVLSVLLPFAWQPAYLNICLFFFFFFPPFSLITDFKIGNTED